MGKQVISMSDSHIIQPLNHFYTSAQDTRWWTAWEVSGPSSQDELVGHMQLSSQGCVLSDVPSHNRSAVNWFLVYLRLMRRHQSNKCQVKSVLIELQVVSGGGVQPAGLIQQSYSNQWQANWQQHEETAANWLQACPAPTPGDWWDPLLSVFVRTKCLEVLEAHLSDEVWSS